MKTTTVNHRNAIATLIVILFPFAVVGGLLGTIMSPQMTKTAMVFYPLFDVVFLYGIWWSYKNEGFKD